MGKPVYSQSAVVPYIIENDVIKVIMITSLNTGQWSIPKGNVEDYLTPQASALKEAEEEAGIFGDVVGEQLCEYTYEKWGGICRVDVYAMQVQHIAEEWDESDIRKRVIIPIDEAIKKIRPEQQIALHSLRESLR